MSLIVYPYKRNIRTNEVEKAEVQLPSPFSELFGFESWRIKVWGSKTLINLGCKMLPSLAYKDIYAENEELYLLKREIELVLENLSEGIFDDSSAVKFRLQNAEEVIRIAIKNENWGVYIG